MRPDAACVPLGGARRPRKTLFAARADGKLLAKVTQHWFRHLLATRMRYDLKSAMEQGGWRDERSVLGYVIDVPEGRRAIVNGFEDFTRGRRRLRQTSNSSDRLSFLSR